VRSLALLAIAAVVGAVPAAAQRRVAPEDVPPVISVDDMPARAKLAGGELRPFAQCVLDRAPADAEALLATPPASAASRSAAMAMGRKGAPCAPQLGKFRRNDVAIRGAVAEQVYLSRYAAAPAAPTSAIADYRYVGGPAMVRYEVARCAALRDPVAADALVRASSGSPEEKAALPLVVTAAGGCIPPHTDMGFDRAELHALLSEALLTIRGGA
jgi:hypothetical protein